MTNTRKFVIRLSLLMFTALACSSFALADVTGGISGTVRDATGAVVAGAHVTVTNVSTNFVQSATSNPAGEYRILALPAGTYALHASAPGFQDFTATAIDVTVNAQLRINVTLALGNVNQSVNVVANALQVETSDTAIGGVIESKQIVAMPLNGRSYLDLLGLQAGVNPVTSGTIPNDRPVSGLTVNPGNVSVGGQPESGNQFLVNGGDVNESKNMGAGLIPNLDSIAEFRLITNSYDAEYGKFTGAIMNAITKSGTNSIHGDAFEFLRNDALDATNYFDTSKAKLRQNQFGYAAGGPFWKNKLFWFTDYQATRITQGASTGNVQVPSLQNRQGIFGVSAFQGGNGPMTVNGVYWAQVLASRLGYAVHDGEPYASTGCTSIAACVFPGGIIPARAFDKISVNLNRYIPLPNINANTYSNNSLNGTVRDDKAGQHVDFNNAAAGTLSFYYHFDDATVFSPLGGSFGFGSNAESRAQMFTASDIKQIGASAVNEFRLSYFRTSVQTAIPVGGTADLSSLGFVTGAGTLGIIPSGPPGYPSVIPPINTNNFQIGGNYYNFYQANNTGQGSDSFSKIIGQHSLKFGAEFRYYQVNARNVAIPDGQFNFSGQETGSDYADYLLGAASMYTQSTLQLQDERDKYAGVYAQDTWKASQNVVLNLGVRWDLGQPWYDWQGKTETFAPNTQSVLYPKAPPGLRVPGDPGVPLTVSPTRYNNFSPRLGIAYAPSFDSSSLMGKIVGAPGKTSIRAAFGTFFLGPADLSNFGIFGDAPFGLYWISLAPTLFDTPFITRSNGTSQTQRFPFTIPTPGDPNNKNIDFKVFYPLNVPGYATNNKTPYTYQYQFSIQRELSPATVLTVAYVGTNSRHLEQDKNINVASGALCNQLNAEGVTPRCVPNGEASVFVAPNGQKTYGTYIGMNNQSIGATQTGVVTYSQVQSLSNSGDSNYNSLQVTLERQARNVSFLAAYTYSKSFDDVNSAYAQQYAYLARVLSPWDLRNNFVLSANWSLPFYEAFTHAPGRLTKGWALAGITHFAGGFPVTLSEGDDQSLTGNIGLDLPNQVAPVVTQNPRKPGPDGTPNIYFHPSSFTPEALGMVGNATRRFFPGPGIVSTDANLSKVTQIHNSMSLLLRVEFFNIFNHADFNNPNGSISSGQFGQVTSARDPRIGQLAAKFIF